MGLVYVARVVRSLGDTMPLVGCPHGHDCEYARTWAFELQQLALDLDGDIGSPPNDGATLYELTRRGERAGEIHIPR